MRIVVFGVGRFYQERRHRISSDVEIVAFLDNNKNLQGQSIDGHPIASPGEAGKFCYDKIVLMSASEEEMKCQLLELGIKRENIWYWDCFKSEMCRGTFKIYCGNDDVKRHGRRILIVSTYLDYTGAPIAAMYAARALRDKGYVVFLAAPSGDKIFIDEAVENGLNIVLCPALPYVHKEELMWIRQFDAVLVNTFPMILSACKISRIRPVLWWIHESERLLYDNIINRFEEYAGKEQLEKAVICAVSRVAQSKFNFYFSDRIKEILSYGIPDQKKKASLYDVTKPLIFAIIGTVHPGKAQDVFVKAIEMLHVEEKKQVQFWIIGSIGMDEYGGEVREKGSKEPAIKIMGRLTRNEIYQVYEEIDVVVCPSLEDSLPIVATEAMMYGKACIVSNATGTAEYIENGKSGLICKAGDAEDLCEKMRWIIRNREKLQTLGDEARKIYEKHFTMDNFGERLEKVLQRTIEGFCGEHP